MNPTRLIPFVVNVNAAYVLEIGEGFMKFYKDGALIESPPGTALSLVTPWLWADLAGIDYCQDADEMFFAHQDYPIYRLVRYADDVWRFAAAPFSATPFDEIGARFNAALTLSAATGTGITVTAGASAFLVTDIGRAIIYGAGAAVITAYTSDTVVTADVRSDFTVTTLPANEWVLDISPQTTCTPSAVGPVGSTISLTLGAAGWRAQDLGKWVRLNGGLVRLTIYTSTTSMSGVVQVELTGTSAAPALAWTLEGSVWNQYDGYPRTLTFHEQRLIASGSPTFPQTVWGSRTGEYLDFTLLSDDSGGFAFTIASDETNQIAYMVSAKHLLALTFGGEFSLRNVEGKPLTPTAVRIEPEGTFGCANVRPVTIARDTLFVQRSGKKIRATRYEYEPDGWNSDDISALADHLIRTGIVEMAYQPEPDSLLWMVLGDGTLATITIDRNQNVIGWASHDIGGQVKSICCIPTAESDQLWFCVLREIDGATVRYIERMDMTPTSQIESEANLLQTDCASVLTAESATAAWTGMDYLEGETVKVIGNGIVQRDGQVASGQVDIERPVNNVQLGLGYGSYVDLLTPEFGTGEGTIQGTTMSTSEVTLRLLETIGAKVNGRVVPFRNLGPAVLDFPPELFTGDISLGALGWDKGRSDLVISQEQPLPFHLLSVIRVFTSNAG